MLFPIHADIVVALSGAPNVLLLTNLLQQRSDINGSGRVDGFDLARLARAFGSADGDSAYDATTDTLYAADDYTDTLYVIDPVTAAATPVGTAGSLRFPATRGLAHR